MDNVCNSGCAGGESRTGISLSIPQSNAQVAFLFFICYFFTGTVECANVHVHVVPK